MPRAGKKKERRGAANGFEIFWGSNEVFWNQIVMIHSQLCDCNKKSLNYIIKKGELLKKVSFMVYELYLEHEISQSRPALFNPIDCSVQFSSIQLLSLVRLFVTP